MLLVFFCFSIIGCSQADRVNGLIQSLGDKGFNGGEMAAPAEALVAIGEPAIEPLVEALKNGEGQWEAAKALSEIGESIYVKPLFEFLNDDDLKVIAGVYPLFISRANAWTYRVLAEVLNKYGDENMAQDFLNTGDPVLSDAVQEWAPHHGYEVIPKGGWANFIDEMNQN